MILLLLKTLGGLALLTLGAELLVQGAASLARRIGLSPLVIGLTVVSIGTSLPELVVSLDAVLKDSAAIGVGNIVGSNISNITLILGLAALVRPLQVKAQVVRVDGPILVVVSGGLALLVQDGQLGRLDGAVLLSGAIGYLAYTAWASQGSPGAVQDEFAEGLPVQHGLLLDAGFVVLGLGGLLGGADWLVDGAVQIAEAFAVPQVVIGLTAVALGTSLPEMATSVLAAYRGEGDLAVGNAVGSSVLNILGILGLTAAVQPVPTGSLSDLGLWAMVGTAVLVLPLLRTGFVLGRREGALLGALYLGYLGLLFGGILG
jgi:cation:H+ antiporter